MKRRVGLLRKPSVSTPILDGPAEVTGKRKRDKVPEEVQIVQSTLCKPHIEEKPRPDAAAVKPLVATVSTPAQASTVSTVVTTIRASAGRRSAEVASTPVGTGASVGHKKQEPASRSHRLTAQLGQGQGDYLWLQRAAASTSRGVRKSRTCIYCRATSASSWTTLDLCSTYSSEMAPLEDVMCERCALPLRLLSARDFTRAIRECRGLPSELVAIVKAAVAFETASGSDDTGAGGASSAQRSITRKKASPTPEVLPSPSVSAKGASQGHASLSAAPHTRSKGRCPSPSSRVPAPLGVTAAGADDAAFEAATATASSGSSAGAAADQAEVAEGDAETGDADDDDDDDDDAASSQTAPKG